MAVVTAKSTTITNRDAAPPVVTNSYISRSAPKTAFGYATTTATDSIGSKYIIAQIPSNCRVSVVSLLCDAITGAAANVGVYQTTANGGAAVNASFFASAQSIATALKATDVTNQSGTYTIALQEQLIWKALGLAADPGGAFDVAVALSAAASAVGNVALRVTYDE